MIRRRGLLVGVDTAVLPARLKCSLHLHLDAHPVEAGRSAVLSRVKRALPTRYHTNTAIDLVMVVLGARLV